MTPIKSSKGRIVDLSQLIAQHQFVRAVGNMNVNARGDVIDSNNNIVVPVNERVATLHNQVVKQKIEESIPPESPMNNFNPVGLKADKPKPTTDLTPEEREFDDE